MERGEEVRWRLRGSFGDVGKMCYFWTAGIGEHINSRVPKSSSSLFSLALNLILVSLLNTIPLNKPLWTPSTLQSKIPQPRVLPTQSDHYYTQDRVLESFPAPSLQVMKHRIEVPLGPGRGVWRRRSKSRFTKLCGDYWGGFMYYQSRRAR